MLTAMILICSLANTPDIANCSRINAVDVLWAPESFSNAAMCFMQAQAYVAGNAVGRQLTANERVKVICSRKEAEGEGHAGVAKGN